MFLSLRSLKKKKIFILENRRRLDQTKVTNVANSGLVLSPNVFL